jgi:hypothetical protein
LIIGFLILPLARCGILNPYEPVAIFSGTQTSLYSRMDIRGNHIYLTETFTGLNIVDVSDPEAPALISTYSPQVGEIRNVIALGEFVLVINNKIGIEVLDVTDPTEPKQVNTYPVKFERPVYEFVGEGNLIYISELDRRKITIKIIDASDPLELRLVAQIEDSAYPIAIEDGILFARKSFLTAEALEDELSIYDVSDISNVELLYRGTDDVGYIDCVEIQDDILYVGNPLQGFRIVDISDIKNPKKLHSMEFYQNACLIEGDYLYSGKLNFIMVVDISDPESPHEVAYYDGLTSVARMKKMNGYIFVLDAYGLYIFKSFNN